MSLTSLCIYASPSISSSTITSLMSLTGFWCCVVLEQLVQSHPTEHSFPCFLHLHLLVVHPVAHLHPSNNVLTLSFTALMFSLLSHSTLSELSLSCQPQQVSGASFIVHVSACFHISITQQALFQCSNSASLDGGVQLCVHHVQFYRVLGFLTQHCINLW